MNTTAIYPGSFDPFTSGHLDIVRQAMNVVGELYVLVAYNPQKDHYFDLDQRVDIARRSVEQTDPERIHVEGNTGLTSDFIEERGVDLICRGLRNGDDLRYEAELEVFFNETTEAQTFYLSPDSQHLKTSSTVVRRFLKAGEVEQANEYVEVDFDDTHAGEGFG